MLLIPLVFLAIHLHPIVVAREEHIGLGGRIVNLREQQSGGHTHGLPIHTGPTYYIYVLVGTAMVERLLQRHEAVASRESRVAMCLRVADASAQHDVPPVGQCALGKALKRLASHDDCVAGRELLEPFQVVGQPVEQLVLEADGSVAGHSSNNADLSCRRVVLHVFCHLRLRSYKEFFIPQNNNQKSHTPILLYS